MALRNETRKSIIVVVHPWLGLNPRVTVEPGQNGRQSPASWPAFNVYDLASYLASGMTEEEILRLPYLEKKTSACVRVLRQFRPKILLQTGNCSNWENGAFSGLTPFAFTEFRK